MALYWYEYVMYESIDLNNTKRTENENMKITFFTAFKQSEGKRYQRFVMSNVRNIKYQIGSIL